MRKESQALVEMMNNLQPSSRKILLKTQSGKLMEAQIKFQFLSSNEVAAINGDHHERDEERASETSRRCVPMAGLWLLPAFLSLSTNPLPVSAHAWLFKTPQIHPPTLMRTCKSGHLSHTHIPTPSYFSRHLTFSLSLHHICIIPINPWFQTHLNSSYTHNCS